MTPYLKEKYKTTLGYGVKYPSNLQWVTKDGFHHGIDKATPIGTKIYAPLNCIVTKMSDSQTAGLMLGIKFFKDKEIYRILFMHLSKISALKIGDNVKEGALIALSGDSGMAKGHSHLHAECQKYHFASMEWRHINPISIGLSN